VQFRLCTVCFLLICSVLAKAQIRINEVSSSNKTVIDDEDGDSSDWVEIYNDGTTEVNLDGFYLSDSQNDSTKWQFGNVLVPGGGYLLVFASDKDRPNGNQPHTNFKLSKDGESIWLYSATKELVDSLTIPFLSIDVSFGCTEDGGYTRAFFKTPTPGSTNNNSVFIDHIIAYAPIFSHSSGIYSSPFELNITSSEPDAIIKYSMDGSEPSELSTVYDSPALISENTIITAKIFKAGLIESKAVIGSFIFRDQQTLPIISLSTHPGYFFDADTGIYEFGPNASPEFPYLGANFWSDTEIPVNVQWIDEYGRIGFDQKMGVRIHGGSVSRTRPMRSLRVLADAKYGKDEVEYSLFENKIQSSNKRFVLRNSGSDYMKTMFRDGFLANHFINNQLHVDAGSYRPVEVYLNGNFWGIHNVREKVDRYYLRNNFGIDEDNLDMLEEQDQIMEGDYQIFEDMESQVLALDASLDSEFAIADSLFDVLNMADYFICQTYTNNLDWPYNNLKYWRERKTGAKWRYIIFDLDVTFGGVSFDPVEVDALSRALGPFGDNNRHVLIFRKLLENRSYLEYFVNRYCDLVNTIFSKEWLGEAEEKAAKKIEPVIPQHFERWNTNLDQWYEEIEIAREYIEQRPPYATDYLQDFFELGKQSGLNLNVFPPQAGRIKLNSITVKSFPFSGTYFEDIPISVQAEAHQGFTFSHWELNRTDVNSQGIELGFLPSDGDSLTAVFVGNSTYNLLKLQPNPASSTTTAHFVNQRKGQVAVYLTSIDGSVKQELFNQTLLTGSHNLELNLPTSLQGIYLITVVTETNSHSQKLVLVKQN